MNRLVLAGILAAILAASGGMAGTLAAQGGGTACRHAACGNYVDDNGDGVCDNIGAGGGCHAHHGGRSGHCHGNK